jgi:hypothetical protein
MHKKVYPMSRENPMLQTPVWTFADMAVAQDWELERGNEGALIWTDLGPELARMVCENPEVLGMLTGVAVSFRARAEAGVWARARAWARAGEWAWAGVRNVAWARTRARAGIGEWAEALAGTWVGARAGAGAGNFYA